MSGSKPGDLLKVDLGRRISYLLIILISVIVYLNTLQNDFVYDDRQEILDNRYIRDIRYLPEILISPFWEFITTSPQWGFIPKHEKISSNYYRPAKSIVYLVTYYLFGLESWGFHLVNILLNSLVPLLVFLISIRFMDKISYSLISAILFAVHPIHTEVVAWASSMQEIIFALSYLGAFYIYMDKSPSWSRLNISAFLFLLALLSKETGMTLPMILIIFDYIFRKIDIKRYIPYLFVIIIYLSIRIYALGGLAPQIVRTDINNYQLLLNVSPLLIRYILKLLFPIDLNMYIMYQPLLSLTMMACLSVSIVLSISFIIIYHLKKKRPWTFFCLWIPVTLMPVLYIKGLGGALIAERYLYLPSVGFSILIAYLVSRTELDNRRLKILFPIIIIFSLYAYQTIERNRDWKDEITLYEKTLTQSPDASSMHYNLANAYYRKGVIDKAINEYQETLRLDYDLYDAHISLGNIYKDKGIFDKAIEEYKYGLSIFPDHSGININLGIVYQRLGMIDKAIERFKDAVRTTPHYSDAHYNLANAYRENGMIDKAIEEYKEAIRSDSYNIDAYYQLATLYNQNGHKDSAIKIYKDLLDHDPMQLGGHINLGNIYRENGIIDKAIEEYKEAIKIDPISPDAHNNLAGIYALKGLYTLAEAEYHEVLKTNPDFFGGHYNLGNIYYLKGELDKALTEYKKALKIKPDFKGIDIKIENINRLIIGRAKPGTGSKGKNLKP